jgi:ketosteroid isomerase-like protein
MVAWREGVSVGKPLTLGVKAMSDRVTIATAFLDAFARRDHARLLSLLTPDAEFSTRVHILPEMEFKGREEVSARFGVVDDEYDRFEVLDICCRDGADGSVLVTCRLALTFKGEAYGQSRRAHWLFRIDEELGQVASITSYRDLPDALRAAGLTDRAFSSGGA